MRYWIMGAGGIGQALAKACVARGEQVVLFSRTDPKLPQVHWQQVDNTDEQALAAATHAFPLPDRVINTLGMLQQGLQQPEKSIEQLSKAALLNSIHINTWPTLAMAQLLAKRLTRTQPLLFAALSARVGSISDNRRGGWYSYRMSKAALNMALKTISIEWQRRFPAAMVVGLHPGTVDTALSAPFSRGLPEGQLQTPSQAAPHLLEVLDTRTLAHSGGIFAWDGKEIQP